MIGSEENSTPSENPKLPSQLFDPENNKQDREVLQQINADLAALHAAANNVPLEQIPELEKGDLSAQIDDSVSVDNLGVGYSEDKSRRIRVFSPKLFIPAHNLEMPRDAIKEGMVGSGYFNISPDAKEIETNVHIDRETVPAVRKLIKEDPRWMQHLRTSYDFSNNRANKTNYLPRRIEDNTRAWIDPPPAISEYRYAKKSLKSSLAVDDIQIINFVLAQAKAALKPWMK